MKVHVVQGCHRKRDVDYDDEHESTNTSPSLVTTCVVVRLDSVLEGLSRKSRTKDVDAALLFLSQLIDS